MIKSFASAETESIWRARRVKRLPADIQDRALRKLRLPHAARSLADLRNPPGNRLEALSRDRAGQHSLRINDQWRLCFMWRDCDAYEVEIVDYHR